LLDENRASESEAALKQAVRYHPAPARAELLLGEICFRQDRNDEAVAHFEAATHDPQTAGLGHYGMGVILKTQGRMREALEHLSAAQQIDPSIRGLDQALQEVRARMPAPGFAPK